MNKTPPRTFVPDKIIGLLIKNESMTFTQLQKSIEISRPTLSRHLKSLLQYDTIEYEKKGREKYYSLNKKKSAVKAKNYYMIMNHAKNAFGHIEHFSKNDDSQMFENIEKRLTSYFLFLILHSLKTGENFYEAFDHRRIGFSMFNYISSIIFQKEKAPRDFEHIMNKDELDAFCFMTNKAIQDQHKEKTLDKMIKYLGKKYPIDVSSMNYTYDDMQEFY